MKALAFFLVLCITSVSVHSQPLPHPADPAIQAIVNQISPDSIYASVERLQAFHTRHTFSDTTSNTVGIGAALRWMQAKVDSNDNASSFSFEWFPWTQGQTRHNLIARKSGAASERGRYIIGGHIDSRNVNGNDNTGFAPGANDNGSSCGAFLEMARLFSNTTTAHDLEIIWFTGEEQGLLGSAAYANHLDAEDERVDGMIAMDMNSRVRAPNGDIDSMSLRLYASGTNAQGSSTSPSRRLQRYLRWIGEAYVPGFEMVIIAASDRPGRGSDHLSFSNRGFPGVRFIERNEDTAFQHDTTDVVEELVPTYARRNAICAMAGLLTMLNAPLTPAAPVVSGTDSGYAIITVPESIELPAGGRFLLSKRDITNHYWDEIFDLGASREFVYGPDHSGASVWFALSVVNSEGHPSPFSEEAHADITSDAREPEVLATEFALAVYPNPFNPAVTIRYSLTSPEHVRVAAYDLLGRTTAVIQDGVFRQGTHETVWQPDNLAGGIYFVRLSTADKSETQKILYLK